MTTILSVRDLKKVIGKKTLVEDISFDVKKGEVFGFLGSNGAGKTTTIRMLVGLITRQKVRFLSVVIRLRTISERRCVKLGVSLKTQSCIHI